MAGYWAEMYFTNLEPVPIQIERAALQAFQD